jgi:hypothetical protein
MIKSRKKTTIYLSTGEKSRYKLDSYHNWDYSGHSKNIGSKYNSSNFFVDKYRWTVKKNHNNMDLNDA